MLIEFRVANHRSLRDEQILTMESPRSDGVSDRRPRQVAGCAESLLPVAALYGANASGKSNVLAAFAFMRQAVVMSHRLWSPKEGVPREPFAWGPSKEEPSLFEVTFIYDGVRFQYGFVASSSAFLEEWLYAWPNAKKQTWFTRENNEFKFGENLRGENKLIEEVTRPNALFVSVAAQHRHLQLDSVFSWFRSIRPINLSRSRYWQDHVDVGVVSIFDEAAEEPSSGTLFPELGHETLASKFTSLLRSADIGIVDVKVNKSDGERRARSFQLKHQSGTDDSWLPLEEESRGTQTLFRIALPILKAVGNGGILVVDELESSLHPALAQEIVRQFNDPATNPRNAQLIFTTHDTNLLGTIQGQPALRRDQVWLTEKDPEGASVLYPMTDYKPRKNENLERGYIQGRYGAVPFLGNFLVAGA